MKRKPTLFRQTTEWTCGPSCVMMARSIFENDFLPSRKLEMEIGHRTITHPYKYLYTTHPKLAIILLEAGYETELWHLSEKCFEYKPGGMSLYEFTDRMSYYHKFKDEALQKGMKTRCFQYSSADIGASIQVNKVAIVFSKIGFSSSIFHHRLVYGYEDGIFKLVCPIEGFCEITASKLDELTATYYGRGALIIGRRNFEK